MQPRPSSALHLFSTPFSFRRGQHVVQRHCVEMHLPNPLQHLLLGVAERLSRLALAPKAALVLLEEADGGQVQHALLATSPRPLGSCRRSIQQLLLLHRPQRPARRLQMPLYDGHVGLFGDSMAEQRRRRGCGAAVLGSQEHSGGREVQLMHEGGSDAWKIPVEQLLQAGRRAAAEAYVSRFVEGQEVVAPVQHIGAWAELCQSWGAAGARVRHIYGSEFGGKFLLPARKCTR
eukprot:scaffold363_cov255-Pinguiococcus_pyrenoidosus.AAC.13